MSTPRLPFLHPTFFRSLRLSEAGPASRHATARRKARSAQPRPQQQLGEGRGSASRRAFKTSARRVAAGPNQRYGTANEPVPPPLAGSASAKDVKDAAPAPAKTAREGGTEGADAAAEKQKKNHTEPGGSLAEEKGSKASPASSSSSNNAEANADTAAADAPPKASPTIFETEGSPTAVPPRPKRDTTSQAAESSPLEAVLRMPAPQPHAPHLTTPRYVHHFDTWGLVKQLERSGFSEEQSVSVMKAIRAKLAENMELARAGLVSKSDVENETYLFRAACSELRTEVGNNRKAENERMTTQRNQLQHEVDILGQRMGQEGSNVKDELKGMFNDRKMAVRMEQSAMETKIQELNYKITVALNSDARSDVEGLRWIITRRAVTALVVVAAGIIATLNYNSYMTRTQEQARKHMATKPKQPLASSGSGGGSGGGESSGGGGWNAGESMGEQGAGDGVIVGEGGVSLG